MSYDLDRPDSWTNCSKKDFKEWYRSKGHACLEEEVSQVSCGDTWCADLYNVAAE